MKDVLTVNQLISSLLSSGLSPRDAIQKVGFNRDGHPGMVEDIGLFQFFHPIVPWNGSERLPTSTRLNPAKQTLVRWALENEAIEVEDRWVGSQSSGQMREVYVSKT